MRTIFTIGVFCKAALIIAPFLPCSSIAQEISAELRIKKAGYLLSVGASRLNVIRSDLLEIRKKYSLLNESDDLGLYPITLLIKNISMVETICVYEGLLLNTLDKLEKKRKFEQYDFHYSRIEKSTLKKLYVINRSIQAYINDSEDKEVSILAMVAKEEILKIQKIFEDVMSIQYDQKNSTP